MLNAYNYWMDSVRVCRAKKEKGKCGSPIETFLALFTDLGNGSLLLVKCSLVYEYNKEAWRNSIMKDMAQHSVLGRAGEPGARCIRYDKTREDHLLCSLPAEIPPTR